MNVRLLLSALAIVVVAVLLSCSDDPTEPKRPTPADIAAVAGDSQTGEVGTPLEAELAVVVRDQQGRPLAGAKVTWASEDGGTFSGSGESDEQGVARTSWILGPVAGQQVASAQVGRLPAVRFTATAVPGPATELVVIGDSVLQGFANEQVLDSIVVEARDAHGNTVAAAPLEWMVVAGGGSIEGPEATREDGRASGLWTLGPDDGTQQIAVALPQIDSVRITASAFSPNTSTRVQIDSGVPEEARLKITSVISTEGSSPPGTTIGFDPRSPTLFALNADGRVVLAAEANAGSLTRINATSTATSLVRASAQFVVGVEDESEIQSAIERSQGTDSFKALVTAIQNALDSGGTWQDDESVLAEIGAVWIALWGNEVAGAAPSRKPIVLNDQILDGRLFTLELREDGKSAAGWGFGTITIRPLRSQIIVKTEIESWEGTRRDTLHEESVTFTYSRDWSHVLRFRQDDGTIEMNMTSALNRTIGTALSFLPGDASCYAQQIHEHVKKSPIWNAAIKQRDGNLALDAIAASVDVSSVPGIVASCAASDVIVSYIAARFSLFGSLLAAYELIGTVGELRDIARMWSDLSIYLDIPIDYTLCIDGGDSIPCVRSITAESGQIELPPGASRTLSFALRGYEDQVLSNRDVFWTSRNPEIVSVSSAASETNSVSALQEGESWVVAEIEDLADSVLVVVTEDEDEGEGGDGGSSGDPHLLTIDGLAYDFMGTGDYILVTSTSSDDRFEVQARHKRLGTSQVSVNDAVAVRGPGSVVNVFSSPTAVPRILADGEEIPTGDGTHLLPDGTTLAVNGGVVWISHPDGTMVGVGLHLDQVGWIHTHLPHHRRGAVEGLLGDFDGDASNDLRIRGGEVLANPTHRQLHTAFRDSWRVPLGSAGSLFAEGPDLYDASFPSAPITLADLDPAVVERAEEVCRAAGVRHKATLEGCILDIALTGDDSWARAAYEADPTIVRIRISPAAGYIRPGESLSLQAVVGGITNDPINWSATGGTVTPSGRSAARYVAPNAPGVYEVRATIAGAEPAVAVMNVAGGRVRTWIGEHGTGWESGRNWEPAGIPAEGDTVVIPAGTPYQLDLRRSGTTFNRTVRSLIVEPGARITIGAQLTVIDEFLNEGEFISVGNPRLVLLGDSVGLRGELPSLEVHGIAHLVGNVNLGRGGLNLREGRLHLDGHTFRAIQVSSDSASRILMSSPMDSLVVERGILLHKAASTITSGAIVTPSISIPEHYVAPRSVRITINTNGSNDRITVADSTSSFSVLEIRGSQPLAGYNQFIVTDSLVVSDPISITGRGPVVLRGVLSTVEGSEWLGTVELYHQSGTSLIEGDFRPSRVTFSGEEQLIRGGLGYNQLYVNGTAMFDGDANADRLQVSGELTIPDGTTIDVGTLYLEDGAVLRNFGRILYGTFHAASTAIVEGNPPEPRDDP